MATPGSWQLWQSFSEELIALDHTIHVSSTESRYLRAFNGAQGLVRLLAREVEIIDPRFLFTVIPAGLFPLDLKVGELNHLEFLLVWENLSGNHQAGVHLNRDSEPSILLTGQPRHWDEQTAEEFKCGLWPRREDILELFDEALDVMRLRQKGHWPMFYSSELEPKWVDYGESDVCLTLMTEWFDLGGNLRTVQIDLYIAYTSPTVTIDTYSIGKSLPPVLVHEMEKHQQLRDVWPRSRSPPYVHYAKQGVVNSIIDQISQTPLTLVYNCNGLWQTAFNFSDKAIFDMMDSISPNFKRCFRIVKYLRDLKLPFFGDVDNPPELVSDAIAIHILKNLVVKQLFIHRQPVEWKDALLPERVYEILRDLQQELADSGVPNPMCVRDCHFNLTDILKTLVYEAQNPRNEIETHSLPIYSRLLTSDLEDLMSTFQEAQQEYHRESNSPVRPHSESSGLNVEGATHRDNASKYRKIDTNKSGRLSTGVRNSGNRGKSQQDNPNSQAGKSGKQKSRPPGPMVTASNDSINDWMNKNYYDNQSLATSQGVRTTRNTPGYRAWKEQRHPIGQSTAPYDYGVDNSVSEYPQTSINRSRHRDLSTAVSSVHTYRNPRLEKRRHQQVEEAKQRFWEANKANYPMPAPSLNPTTPKSILLTESSKRIQKKSVKIIDKDTILESHGGDSEDEAELERMRKEEVNEVKWRFQHLNTAQGDQTTSGDLNTTEDQTEGTTYTQPADHMAGPQVNPRRTTNADSFSGHVLEMRPVHPLPPSQQDTYPAKRPIATRGQADGKEMEVPSKNPGKNMADHKAPEFEVFDDGFDRQINWPIKDTVTRQVASSPLVVSKPNTRGNNAKKSDSTEISTKMIAAMATQSQKPPNEKMADVNDVESEPGMIHQYLGQSNIESDTVTGTGTSSRYSENHITGTSLRNDENHITGTSSRYEYNDSTNTGMNLNQNTWRKQHMNGQENYNNNANGSENDENTVSDQSGTHPEYYDTQTPDKLMSEEESNSNSNPMRNNETSSTLQNGSMNIQPLYSSEVNQNNSANGLAGVTENQRNNANGLAGVTANQNNNANGLEGETDNQTNNANGIEGETNQNNNTNGLGVTDNEKAGTQRQGESGDGGVSKADDGSGNYVADGARLERVPSNLSLKVRTTVYQKPKDDNDLKGNNGNTENDKSKDNNHKEGEENEDYNHKVSEESKDYNHKISEVSKDHKASEGNTDHNTSEGNTDHKEDANNSRDKEGECSIDQEDDAADKVTSDDENKAEIGEDHSGEEGIQPYRGGEPSPRDRSPGPRDTVAEVGSTVGDRGGGDSMLGDNNSEPSTQLDKTGDSEIQANDASHRGASPFSGSPPPSQTDPNASTTHPPQLPPNQPSAPASPVSEASPVPLPYRSHSSNNPIAPAHPVSRGPVRAGAHPPADTRAASPFPAPPSPDYSLQSSQYPTALVSASRAPTPLDDFPEFQGLTREDTLDYQTPSPTCMPVTCEPPSRPVGLVTIHVGPGRPPKDTQRSDHKGPQHGVDPQLEDTDSPGEVTAMLPDREASFDSQMTYTEQVQKTVFHVSWSRHALELRPSPEKTDRASPTPQEKLLQHGKQLQESGYLTQDAIYTRRDVDLVVPTPKPTLTPVAPDYHPLEPFDSPPQQADKVLVSWAKTPMQIQPARPDFVAIDNKPGDDLSNADSTSLGFGVESSSHEEGNFSVLLKINPYSFGVNRSMSYILYRPYHYTKDTRTLMHFPLVCTSVITVNKQRLTNPAFSTAVSYINNDHPLTPENELEDFERALTLRPRPLTEERPRTDRPPTDRPPSRKPPSKNNDCVIL